MQEWKEIVGWYSWYKSIFDHGERSKIWDLQCTGRVWIIPHSRSVHSLLAGPDVWMLQREDDIYDSLLNLRVSFNALCADECTRNLSTNDQWGSQRALLRSCFYESRIHVLLDTRRAYGARSHNDRTNYEAWPQEQDTQVLFFTEKREATMPCGRQRRKSRESLKGGRNQEVAETQ